MDEFFHGFGFSDFPTLGNIGFIPEIDVKDEKNQYVVKVDVPGMSKEDINVSVENNTLIVSGEKKEETREEKDGYVSVERSSGKFQREVYLGKVVEEDKIDAEYKDGVLTVKLPKMPQLEQAENKKKISIK
jgi:HSP20 family protein